MKVDIKRAWTDAEYRATLSPAEISGLPPNPAGDAELTDDELDNVAGGWIRPPITWACPQPHYVPSDPDATVPSAVTVR